jgi:uncharacterized membrane protein YedE/YeeE
MTGTALSGVLIVVGGTIAAILGLLCVARWRPRWRHEGHNDVMGVFFSMVGVLYGILLAFVVVIVWGDFSDAGSTTQTEVTRISNLSRDAKVFPQATRDRIETSLIAYANSVATDEWKTMAGGKSSPTTTRRYEAVWNDYYRFKPKTHQARAFYDESLARLNELGEARRQRLLSSDSKVPLPLWFLLIGGFVLTVGFTYLFKIDSLRKHAVAVGSIAALSAFVLFLVYALEHPFAGDVKISPEPYTQWIAQQSVPPGGQQTGAVAWSR